MLQPSVLMDFTVIVVTHNRAEILRKTLDALARLSCRGSWEVLVVDNNSTDATPTVVENARAGFPVTLRYLFEPTPGKYTALNAGIQAAAGTFIAATDDDAFPEPDWLDRAADGLRAHECDFVGGPVYPVWQSPPPPWLKPDSALTGKVLGLQDYGGRPCEYGQGRVSWPLGVNVAYRRSAFDTAGFFDGRLGRVAGTLRNQSQREWHLRARAAGLRGMYLPLMVVHHCVAGDRLTQQYFRRWFYWHGVSRAILTQIAGLHLLDPEGGATHETERHLLGVPMSGWRNAFRGAISAAKRRLLGRVSEAVEYEMIVCFWIGVIRQRLRERRAPRPAAGTPGPGAPATSSARTASPALR